jgi:hypothetical protein
MLFQQWYSKIEYTEGPYYVVMMNVQYFIFILDRIYFKAYLICISHNIMRLGLRHTPQQRELQ